MKNPEDNIKYKIVFPKDDHYLEAMDTDELRSIQDSDARYEIIFIS